MKTYREILENYAIADHILEVLHTYFDECLASGLTEVTVFSKCYILGKFYQLFDHNIKLTDTHLNKIYKIAYLKLCENKALSRKREIQTVIRTFVSWMLRNDIVEEDATRAFPKISLRNYEYAANENHKTRQAFNDTLRPVIEIELKRMKLPLHYRLCLTTMVSFGTRISETLSLTRDDFLEKNGIIYVHIKHSKTKAGKRVVPVGGEEAALLSYILLESDKLHAKLIEKGQECNFHFMPSSRRNVYVKVRKIFGISLHSFRKNYATRTLTNSLDKNPGATLLSLQKRMGHTNLSTTLKHYLKVVEEENIIATNDLF